MRKHLKGALIGLFLTTLLLGCTGAYIIFNLQSNTKLINYVGIVRGATQRLVKLEIEHQPNDEIMQYLDDIMDELNGEKGRYGLPAPKDNNYQSHLKDLTSMWSDLKQTIQKHREDSTLNKQLMLESEAYFKQANDTVFSAESYTNSKLHELMYVWGIMLAMILMVWLFILWAASKKMLDLETANRRLNDIMKRDNLTGVYQYKYFCEKAQQLLDKNQSNHYAVVYTDFSDFKYFNDVFGYNYGDSILSSYGNILLENLDNDELCGRVSADHFVLLVKYTRREDVAIRQRKADMHIRDFMKDAYHHQILTTCCGICCIDSIEEKLTIEGYVDRANFARSTVKSGKNPNYMYYNESIRNHLMEEKNVESRMHAAIDNHEFIVEYQPKVRLKDKKIASAEALVRWKINGETIMPPDSFIPTFERKFMINRLDQYVMEEVCKFQRKLLDEGKHVVPVAVNVSRLQFYDQNFVKNYVAIRDRYHIPYDLIEIEFTESIVFDTGNLLDIIKDLKQNHFKVAIDDFGKGYSSLSLLKEMPVDYLKLDSYFFEKGEDTERDLSLVQGIINIVHDMNIKTIAEGIESEKQVEILKSLGCDYIQGFVFYRPMSEQAYEDVLQQQD